jgi:hypothetical protein
MDKIKQYLKSDSIKNVLTAFIVILVGLGSFGLGRLSKGNSSSGLIVKYQDQTINTPSITEVTENNPKIYTDKTESTKTTQISTSKTFFASKVGQKYYSIGCSGGKTLKPENKIYFATEAEAIAAGYEKSSTCK